MTHPDGSWPLQKPLLAQNGLNPIGGTLEVWIQSIKSIVSIELTAEEPPTFWNTIIYRYPFLSNVDPDVPHPRWSQAEERPLGGTGTIPTLKYNGYEDYVADLYA